VHVQELIQGNLVFILAKGKMLTVDQEVKRGLDK